MSTEARPSSKFPIWVSVRIISSSIIGHTDKTRCTTACEAGYNKWPLQPLAMRAPEVFTGRGIFHASDVWSTGATVRPLSIFLTHAPFFFYRSVLRLTQTNECLWTGTCVAQPRRPWCK